MRLTILAALILSSSLFGHAAIVEFDLSPSGTDSGIGLHPLNEIIPGYSNGSGNEIGSGIFFDTSTRLLTLNLGYGSAFGFTDLTGSAFSWLLHGPSALSETAPVLFNLQSLHAFAPDPTHGGQIVGTITLDTAQEAGLLAGLNYINIYTPENFGGELRGQLVVVPEPSSMLLLGMAVSVVFWRCTKNRRQKSC